jgi:uncharacterized protein
MTTTLASLKNSKTILLTTYKRDGTAVGTPVSIAFDGDRALLEGGQARVAASALARDHRVLQGVLVPTMHRLRRYRTMHYELEPDAG